MKHNLLDRGVDFWSDPVVYSAGALIVMLLGFVTVYLTLRRQRRLLREEEMKLNEEALRKVAMEQKADRERIASRSTNAHGKESDVQNPHLISEGDIRAVTEEDLRAQHSNLDPSLFGRDKWPVGPISESETKQVDDVDDEDKDTEEPGDKKKEKKKYSVITDPISFCEHIPGEVKRLKNKIAREKMEEKMDDEQRRLEQETQREQLAAIFDLLRDQENKFGISSKDDMEEQAKLYV